MATTVAAEFVPPSRLLDLTIRSVGGGSEFVVKNPYSHKYLKIRQVEAFLLGRLDGSTTAGAIQTAFEAKFGEPLTTTELQEFVDLARSQGLVGTSEAPAKLASGIRGSVHNAWRHL